MKVLVVSRWFEEERRRQSGQAGFVGELFHAFAQTDVELTILSQADDAGCIPSPREADGLKLFVYSREKRRTGWAVADKLLKPWGHYRKAVTDAVTIREFIAATGPYDVVIAQCEEPDGLACALASVLGDFPPLVTQVHDLRYRFDGMRVAFVHRSSLSFVFRRSTCVVANSEQTARWLTDHYAVPAEKIDQVRIQLTRPFLNALATQKPVMPEKRILFLGALNRKKAPDVFLRAAALATEHLPEWKFVLAGGATEKEDSWLRSLGAMAEEPPLAGRVEWLGKISSQAVMEEVARAHMVICPSLVETFSRTTVESLALGRPVIVTETTGAARWVRETGAGLIVPPGDALALAWAMRQLAEGDFATATNAAAQLVVNELTPEKAAADLQKIFGALPQEK